MACFFDKDDASSSSLRLQSGLICCRYPRVSGINSERGTPMQLQANPRNTAAQGLRVMIQADIGGHRRLPLIFAAKIRRRIADLESWSVMSEMTTKNRADKTGEPPNMRACNAENHVTRRLKHCQNQAESGLAKRT